MQSNTFDTREKLAVITAIHIAISYGITERFLSLNNHSVQQIDEIDVY